MSVVTWTSEQVARALVRKFLDQPSVGNFFEFQVSTEESGRYGRRCDLFSVFSCGARENPFLLPITNDGLFEDPYAYRDPPPRSLPAGWRIAFEIKVSRADLKRDIGDRWKHAPIARLAHELYFVTPRDLVTDDDWLSLPWGAGLIEVYRDQRKRWLGTPRAAVKRPASINWTPDLTNELFVAMAKRGIWRRASAGADALGQGQAVHQSWPATMEPFEGPGDVSA